MGFSDAVQVGDLRDLLSEVSSRSGRLAVIGGGLASGKSALLREFSQSVTESDALLLSATCTHVEQSLQAGVIEQLLLGVHRDVEQVDRIARLIDAGLAAGDTGGDPWSVRPADVRIVQELCGILLELAQSRPLVIMVDDIQFVDSFSLQVLLYLIRRIQSAPVLVVVTACDPCLPTSYQLHVELTRYAHLDVRLSPLSVDKVAELLGSILSDGKALAPAFHEISGGNPMLVLALVADNAGREFAGPDDRPRPGASFTNSVLSCLSRQDPRLLDVAAALAVLGELGESDLVRRLTGVGAAVVVHALAVLASAGLVDGERFRHQDVAAAVLAGLPADRCSDLRMRAAKLLYQRGAAPTEVVRRILAADRPAEQWSLGVLRDAASEALERGEMQTAVRCLELYLDACVDEQQRADVVKTFIRALWMVNPSAAVRRFTSLRNIDADLVATVRHALWNGDEPAAIQAVELLVDSPDMADDRTVCELRLLLQWFNGSTRGLLKQLDVLPNPGSDPRVESMRALSAVWLHGYDESANAAAEHLLHSHRLVEMTPEVLVVALLILAHGGKPEHAAWWCEHLINESAGRGMLTLQALLTSVSADIALSRGYVEKSAAHARAALDLLPAHGWGVQIGYPLTVLALADVAAGRVEQAAETLNHWVPDAMYGTVFGLRYLRARGRHHLAAGHALAAISDFQECRRLAREWDLDRAEFVPWRTDLADANLQLGRTEVARELMEQQLRQTTAADPRSEGIALRIMAAASDLPAKTELLERAVERLHQAGDRLELATALGELSRVSEQLGQTDKAETLSRRATRELAICHSAEPPVQISASWPVAPEALAAENEAAAVPLLSDAERRVAELAALGHTNREISQLLYVTVSTVEQHLTKVYRKLGVHNRASLPRGLAVRKPAELIDARAAK